MIPTFMFFTLVASFLGLVFGETIVSDNLGNSVTLPLSGGEATAAITNLDSAVATSPYILSVYVNDGTHGGIEGERESFYVHPPSSPSLYGDATLVTQGFSGSFSPASLTPGAYLGNPAAPNILPGLYQFVFNIPAGKEVAVNITYTNSGTVPHPVDEFITILVENPSSSIVGDPQFIGLRGQSYQIHGVDGNVYNLVSAPREQVNAMFSFLSSGSCPMINGKVESVNCWSHPGSYLGALSFQQKVDGVVHRVYVESGPSNQGFFHITFDAEELITGNKRSIGSFSLEVISSHKVIVTMESFKYELLNSDMFINQAVQALKPLKEINAHGLLGQTHQAKVYPTVTRYIEGEVEDYTVSDIYGKDSVYNRF